ncbi:MAG: hypothetical protein ACRCT2_17465 [Plesiomonas shigelloides]
MKDQAGHVSDLFAGRDLDLGYFLERVLLPPLQRLFGICGLDVSGIARAVIWELKSGVYREFCESMGCKYIKYNSVIKSNVGSGRCGVDVGQVFEFLSNSKLVCGQKAGYGYSPEYDEEKKALESGLNSRKLGGFGGFARQCVVCGGHE